jgi:aminoglycoside 3'-phosphotransferase-2
MSEAIEAIARSLLTGADAEAARLEPVASGMSGASVFRVVQPGQLVRYIKIGRGKDAAPVREEASRTSWLSSQGIAVPRILRVSNASDGYAVLMHAMPGTPADVSLLPAPRLIAALAKALAALHAQVPDNCPFDETLAVRLARATQTVAAGGIDAAAFEPRNIATAPEALLARLTAQQPQEDIVVAHGDATLSNLIVDAEGNVGFIDCSCTGRGDRYIDLAVLAADITEHHGAEAAAEFARRYGVDWDEAKARYYADLYELF